MGNDPDLDDRLDAVAGRREFVELLAAEGPLRTRDVVESLDHSRSTVTRALRELRETDVVEKGEEGYTATVAGALAVEEYRRYRSASAAIFEARDLLSGLSHSEAPPVEVLAGAEAVRTEGSVPVRPLEAVSDSVRDADRVRAYLPTLVNPQLLRVWHRTVVGGEGGGRAVVDPDLLTVLKGQYPHLLSEMAASEGFSAWAATGPSYGLVLTTEGGSTAVTVVVYEGGNTVRGVLTNDAPEAVEWARRQLDGLEADGDEVTGDLEVLSGAVADGVSRDLQTAAAGSSGSGPGTSAGKLALDLEAEGFVGLSAEYFDAHREAPPSVSWRTGFTLAEVRAGHAVDRRTEDGDSLTGALVEALRDGEDHVLLGPPGSGKSTVCMSVACEWFDRDLGPVLYREHGAGDRFESTALLEATLRRTPGHALVVVEDAVGGEANAVFDVMRALDADGSVTFLLDARTDEWRDPEGIDPSVDEFRRTAVQERVVPDLDAPECERFVDRFAALVGESPDLSGAELFEMVEEGTGSGGDRVPAGDLLVAQHYLVREHERPADRTGVPTALEEFARRSYERLVDAEDDLLADLGVLVALLTAAGVPVAEEYCYAVADGDYDRVASALERIEGRHVFESRDPRERGPTTYRTRHETWALRFLDAATDVETDAAARERVGRCVTRLLALANDADRRDRIEARLEGRTPFLHQVAADPGGWADELAERLFGVGRTDAYLAGLFGATDDDAIELPDACSGWTRLRAAYWRGEMYLTNGDLARAAGEFHTLEDLAGSVDLAAGSVGAAPTPEFTDGADSSEDVATHRTRWRAASHVKLARTNWKHRDHDAAGRHLRTALARFEEIDDRRGEATALRMLGIVARATGNFEGSREYFERSLAIAREVDARKIEADSHGSLGNLEAIRSAYGRARDHFERSLDVYRDLGDLLGEANSLTSLGLIAERRGAYDDARDYNEQSVAIYRDLGDRHKETRALDLLGEVAYGRGAYDEAREYYERSLELAHELSLEPTKYLVNLGKVAREQGEHDKAEQYLDRATEQSEATDDQRTETLDRLERGELLLERGRLALERDDTELARTLAERSQELFEELGAAHFVGNCRLLQGRVAAAAGRSDRARDHWLEALETFQSIEVYPEVFETLQELVETCREAGEVETARNHCDRARELLAAAPGATARLHREWVQRHADELDGSD